MIGLQMHLKSKGTMAAVVLTILLVGCGQKDGALTTVRNQGPQVTAPAGKSLDVLPETCTSKELPELKVSIPESPGSISDSPAVSDEALGQALAAVRKDSAGRAAIDADGARLANADPWRNQDGHVVGVYLEYEFSGPTDLPNLGVEKRVAVKGNEEDTPLYDERGLPQLVEAGVDNPAQKGVLSGIFYVLLPENNLYYAMGSQDHYYCF